MRFLLYFILTLNILNSQIYIGGNIDQFLKPENKTINLMYYRILYAMDYKKFWVVNSSEQFKTDFTFGLSDYEVLQRNMYQSFSIKIKNHFAIGVFHNITYATISNINKTSSLVLYDYHYSIGLSLNIYSLDLPHGKIDINTDIGYERNFFNSEVMIYPKLTYIYGNIQIRVFSLYDFKNKVSTVAMNLSWKIDLKKIIKKSGS